MTLLTIARSRIGFFFPYGRQFNYQHSRCFFSSILPRNDSERQLAYLDYQRAPNSQKAYALFRWTLHNQLNQHGIAPEGNNQRDWISLQNAFWEKYSVKLPHFSEPSTEMLWGIIHQVRMVSSLAKDSQVLEKYSPEAYIRSGTDLYWSLYPPSIPLSRRTEHLSFNPAKIQYILDQFQGKIPQPLLRSKNDCEALSFALHSVEEDALAAHLLALRHLSQRTVLHEIGCWNGSTGINFFHLANLHNRKPLGFIGTDINYTALNFANLTSKMLGLHGSHFQFYCAHALNRLDHRRLGFEGSKVLRLALRVIPVLDFTSAKEFIKLNCLRDNDVALILSYATRTGQSYENNLAKASEKGGYEYRMEEFDGGVTFYAPFPEHEIYKKFKLEIVANTYFDLKGFQSLVSNLGLHISETITVGRFSDNEREVVAITHR